MDKIRLLAMIFVLLMINILPGCVKQQSVALEEAQQVETGDSFALAVSRMSPGEQAVLPSPYGAESLVLVESIYTSGLGRACRRAQVYAEGIQHRIAVCRDDSGWAVVNPIFEQAHR